MILDDDTGNRFELHVTSQELPSAGEDIEEHWLTVEVQVTTPVGSWSASHDSLMAGEAVYLARWLDGLGRGEPQPDEIDFLEPNLRFSRGWNGGDGIAIRIELTQEMEPPPELVHVFDLDDEDFSYELRTSAARLLEAAADLHVELARCLAPEGEGQVSIIEPAPLAPAFLVDWMFFVGAASEAEAERQVKRYMAWADLPVDVQRCEPRSRVEGAWLVRARTDLHVKSSEYGEALFRLLSHIPMPYGLPRIARPQLLPYGSFQCELYLKVRGPDLAGEFSQVEWACELRNFEDGHWPEHAALLFGDFP